MRCLGQEDLCKFMNNKYKILAIMGKAGSGKDTLMQALLDEPEFIGAVPIISCTTRPIRDNEKDGVNYHFLTKEQFTEQILNGEMLEATVFNDWCYGTSLNNLTTDVLNIGVFNPEGVGLLRENKNIDLTVIYVEATDKTRLLRQLNREENPDCHEIVRRFGADEADFTKQEITYLKPDVFVTNNEGADIHRISKAIAGAWAKGQITLKN